jgi:hypothetical protein
MPSDPLVSLSNHPDRHQTHDWKYSFMNIGQKNSINIHQRSESLCEPPKVSDSVI